MIFHKMSPRGQHNLFVTNHWTTLLSCPMPYSYLSLGTQLIGVNCGWGGGGCVMHKREFPDFQTQKVDTSKIIYNNVQKFLINLSLRYCMVNFNKCSTLI